ncbi:MAG TPA: TRAP transporter TatT component family protein [Kofleriaceae bacterium]|nr:TRAP transporter TatT component family protein [Kofleriaceae bacterium]
MFRPNTFVIGAALLGVTATSCIDTAKLGTKTTSKVLVKAQPALKMESDYDHAARAIPGALKTVEGFHVAYPEFKNLTGILAEGYCQYGTGFVEDEWEIAELIEKDFEKSAYVARRATKMFVRCMNYGLELLGGQWPDKFTGPLDELKPLARSAGSGQRQNLLWAAVGLASSINMNKDDVNMIDMVGTAEWLLKRIVVMDGDGEIFKPTDPAAPWDAKAFEAEFGKKAGVPKDEVHRALPHVALGLLYTSRGEAVGGDPEQGKRHFERAIDITGGKFLLAKVMLARNYGRIRTDREFFRQSLVEVLQTDPAIYPQQRLANEIAHRRARRYLKLEKEWF